VTTIDRTRLPEKQPEIARPTVDATVREPAKAKEKGVLDNLFGDDDEKPAAAPAARHFEAVTETRSAAAFEADKEDSAGRSDRLAAGPTGGSTGSGGEAAAGFDGNRPNGPLGDPAAAPPPMPRPEADVPMPIEEEIAAARSAPPRERAEAKRATTRRPPPHGGSTSGDSRHADPPRPIQPTVPPPRPAEFPRPTDAYDGRFGAVMARITANDRGGALTKAQAWREASPGDELALLALGEAAEALGDKLTAARAYGSLIDLFPGRTDIRRMAGERLEALGDGRAVAGDRHVQSPGGGAAAGPPGEPPAVRVRAAQGGQVTRRRSRRRWSARAAATRGAASRRVQQILDEDLRLIAAAWRRPARRQGDAGGELAAATCRPIRAPSLRFVLNWETDANDVDFHIYDGKGGHAYYSRALPTGGELYADVTTGYGPECFTIPGPALAFPYTLQAHYYSRGPMGYGMGKLQAIDHDGQGHFAIQEHPFVIMKDRAYVDLGRVDAPLAKNPGSARLQPPTGQNPGSNAGTYTPPAPPPAPAQPLPPTRF
jgi:hypothetical protein